MLIFDKTILAFIQKSEIILKEILTEIGIEVKRSRFLVNQYFYPIHIVVFEGKEWGHFNAPYFQIGLNKKLIYSAKDSVLRDILKHELAHYLTQIEFGDVDAHGKEFHALCARLGFPREISDATMNLNQANLDKVGDLDAERVLEKVKKLLNLAQSSNAPEAEMATVRANALLLRHNLDRLSGDEEPIYLERLLIQKKSSPKMYAIQNILKHFIVKSVLSMGKGTCCLEVSGSLTNVKLAQYVAEFLDREFDYLWSEAKKESGLSGLRAKNSFFVGIAQGFDRKMEASKKEYSEADQKALVVVKADLEAKTQMIYRRLGSTSSSARSDDYANEMGRKKGLGLNIRRGVENSSSGRLISFNKN